MPRALAALAQLALRAAGPVALFGMLVVPSPSGNQTVEGAVPGRPDLKYEWPTGGSILYLHRLIQGQWVTVALGHLGTDWIFRDDAGKPIARVIDAKNRVIAIDIAAISQAERDDKNKQNSQAAVGAAGAAAAGAKAGTAARVKEEPKLCPEPVGEFSESWSENSREYQARVTGLPPPLAIFFNGEWFDGCVEEEKGKLQQATGGRENFLDGDGDWYTWFQGGWKLPDQIDRSYKAAKTAGRLIDWHVQKKRVYDWIAAYVKHENYGDVIKVIYDP
jgi:hypothetical protein